MRNLALVPRSLTMMLWVSFLGDALREEQRIEELMRFATNESHKLNTTLSLDIVDMVIRFQMTITNLGGAVGSWKKMKVLDKFALTQSIMQNLDTCVSFHHRLAQAVLKRGRSFPPYVVEDVPKNEYVMDDLTDAWDKQNKDKECGENVLSVLNKLRDVVAQINIQAEKKG